MRTPSLGWTATYRAFWALALLQATLSLFAVISVGFLFVPGMIPILCAAVVATNSDRPRLLPMFYFVAWALYDLVAWLLLVFAPGWVDVES